MYARIEYIRLKHPSQKQTLSLADFEEAKSHVKKALEQGVEVGVWPRVCKKVRPLISQPARIKYCQQSCKLGSTSLSPASDKTTAKPDAMTAMKDC